MDLTDRDLAELARFLGRRLDVRLDETPPPASEREAADRAAAWSTALHEARTAGTLSALMLRIARRHPNDANLVAAASLVTDPGHGSDGPLVLALLGAAVGSAAIAAAALLAVGWMVVHGVDLSGEHTDVPVLAAIGPGAVDAPVRIERPVPTGRCTRPDGGQVGWWDAGRTFPGEAGQIVRIDGKHNVRDEYPHRGNRWATGTRIRCLLQPGDAVRLGEPVEVDGGRWWVPLTTGDLLPPAVSEGPAPSGTDRQG